MAHIVTVVGAGGKSTFIDRLARRRVAAGQSVAVTTTTHIWDPGISVFSGRSSRPRGWTVAGAPVSPGRLGYPGDREFSRLCAVSDAVLVEGDGAHRMPMKIPDESEPVIPPGSGEIVAVMGLHAVGHRFGTVCQRAERFDPARMPEKFRNVGSDTPVTRDLLTAVAKAYYLQPLRKEYPFLPVRLYLSDLRASGLDADVHRLALVVMASGCGSRFGSNKLEAPLGGKALYRYVLDALLHCRRVLEKEFEGRAAGPLSVEILVVSRYPGILRAVADRKMPGLRAVPNRGANEGIAASVRIGCRQALASGAQALAYFAADQPLLDGEEIASFLTDFLCSGKPFGCLYADRNPVNPGAFRLIPPVRDGLLGLRGDRGAMRLIRRFPADVYCCPVEAWKLRDVDRPEDLEQIRERLGSIRRESR